MRRVLGGCAIGRGSRQLWWEGRESRAENRLGTEGARGCPSQQLSQHPLSPDEEPFLIFANRYYLRKLNLDGSNYTLLKQVQCWPPHQHPQAHSCFPHPVWPLALHSQAHAITPH